MAEDRSALLERVRRVKASSVHHVMGLSNVVACGVGYKITGGQSTGETSVVVSVARKVPMSQLARSQRVPQSIQGFKTDVVETGVIRALQDPKQRMRPARPGVSVGHRDITAGTFGYLVRRGQDVFILSNNHVLANSNNASPGDPILQPGPHDGGTTANDIIARLEDFVPIDFGASPPTCSVAKGVASLVNAAARLLGSHHRVQAIRQTPGTNRVDCAIARPLSPDVVTREILQIGSPTGVATASLGTQVQKFGRTTGYTQGEIVQVDVTVTVNYNGPVAVFTDQLMAGAMSQGGDSGSLVLDMQGRAVGLLFAGSDTNTILSPIGFVLEDLRVEMVT